MQAVPRRRLAHLRRLAQHSSERRKAGQFLIEGAVLLSDALDAGLQVNEVLLERGRAGDAEKAAAERARGKGAVCAEVADGVLARIGASVTPPPILAVAEIPSGGVSGGGVSGSRIPSGQYSGEAKDGHAGRAGVLSGQEEAASGGFSLAAVEIADPSNAGALLRCAEGAGAGEVVFAGNCVDPWGPKAVRASAGSVFRLPPRREPDAAAFLQGLHQSGRQVVATASSRGNPYYEFSYDKAAVIIMGNETHGLPEAIESCVTDWVHIPMSGSAESLNVAMAAAVICFEARRQGASR